MRRPTPKSTLHSSIHKLWSKKGEIPNCAKPLVKCKLFNLNVFELLCRTGSFLDKFGVITKMMPHLHCHQQKPSLDKLKLDERESPFLSDLTDLQCYSPTHYRRLSDTNHLDPTTRTKHCTVLLILFLFFVLCICISFFMYCIKHLLRDCKDLPGELALVLIIKAPLSVSLHSPLTCWRDSNSAITKACVFVSVYFEKWMESRSY